MADMLPEAMLEALAMLEAVGTPEEALKEEHMSRNSD